MHPFSTKSASSRYAIARLVLLRLMYLRVLMPPSKPAGPAWIVVRWEALHFQACCSDEISGHFTEPRAEPQRATS